MLAFLLTVDRRTSSVDRPIDRFKHHLVFLIIFEFMGLV